MVQVLRTIGLEKIFYFATLKTTWVAVLRWLAFAGPERLLGNVSVSFGTIPK
jgi:hypothetical protein